MLGKSKFYRKVYRTYFHLIYGLLVFTSSLVIIMILTSKPYNIYFLIPHFWELYSYLIGYVLTITFPLEILCLIYLLKKNISVLASTIVFIPFGTWIILGLPSAPTIYPHIYLLLYIAILIVTDFLTYILLNEKKLIIISYISALITYILLYSIIILNIVGFMHFHVINIILVGNY